MIKTSLKSIFKNKSCGDIRTRALHQLLACASACTLLVLFVSFKKMGSFHFHTSWFNIILFASGVMTLTFVFRDRLSFTFKETIYFFLLYILAINGAFNVGIAAPALLLFAFIPLFALLMHSRKIAFFHLAISLIFLLFAGYLYSRGVLIPATDLNLYNSSNISWISLSSVTGIMVTLLLMEYRPLELAINSREERIRSIFERSPVAIGLGRADTALLIEVNDAWLQLFGFQKHEVIGKSADELELYVNCDERAELIRQISEHGITRL
jgi:PAS domain-containing protein